MDVLQASKYLVEEVADVIVAQSLGFQQLIQIGLHQTLYDVHVAHLINWARSNDVPYIDDLALDECGQLKFCSQKEEREKTIRLVGHYRPL